MRFTPEEDEKLMKLITLLGTRDWEAIANEMRNRSPRQCRDRWYNYISPDISTTPWTEEDDEKLDKLYDKFGPKWKKIASFFKNRSANGVRNRFRLRQKKRTTESNSESPEVEISQPTKISSCMAQSAVEENILNLFAFTNFAMDENLFDTDI